jgi:hypothetical protein
MRGTEAAIPDLKMTSHARSGTCTSQSHGPQCTYSTVHDPHMLARRNVVKMSKWHASLVTLLLSGSPNSSWLARGRSASGASLSASRNLHSGIKAEICLFAESRLAPRTIDWSTATGRT